MHRRVLTPRTRCPYDYTQSHTSLLDERFTRDYLFLQT